MRTGLAASTVTPGSTAPDASRTTPVMAACAKTAEGRSNRKTRDAADRWAIGHIGFLLEKACGPGTGKCAASHECVAYERRGYVVPSRDDRGPTTGRRPGVRTRGPNCGDRSTRQGATGASAARVYTLWRPRRAAFSE